MIHSQNADDLERQALGVDVGASVLKIAAVDARGDIRAWVTRPTIKPTGSDAFVDWLTVEVTRFAYEAGSPPYVGIGYAMPHYVEGETWVQRATMNVPGLEGAALRPALVKALPLSAAMVNDVAAAAIGEYAYGAGRGVSRLVVVAIGTGVSMCATIDGRLVDYNWGSAGDAGQIIVDATGLPECGCGGRGCLDAVVSGLGIRRRAIAAIGGDRDSMLATLLAEHGDLSASDVADAARAGDPIASDVMAQAGRFLGIGLATYVHLFRPEVIVLTGGVMRSADLLLDSAVATLRDVASPFYLERLQGVVVSSHLAQSAALGAAAIVLNPGRYLRTTSE